MALVIPAGFAQAALQFRNSGDPDPWYVTFGIDTSDAAGDYETVADICIGSWSSSFLGSMTTTTAITGCQLRVGQDGGDPLTLFFATSLPGGSSANKLPQNCALLVSKVTTRSGRTGKGRMFIPNVLTEGAVDNVGVIATEELGTLQGNADDMLDTLADPPAGPAIPMVLLHNGFAPGGTTPTEVASLSVDAVISTQRRRLR